ncbi:hypothetical protein Pla175_09330 [Pirellulimonas nuda]|uniref:VWFA domain-containing protein n=1 Tax=Pirellulimonas nuda TaxID=2528009 RepID=A0A518D7V9_9BACT|nr:vWA domain-containing protein [Pirellulimonas nuda]QDU87568.1 hypothetical protein Pla175_09330 [Pirellulimonas nuda]
MDPRTTDVVWKLETHWAWAPWLTTLVVAAAVAIVVHAYVRESSPAGRSYRTMLALLRLTTLALIAAMLTEALLAGVRTARPRLAVVLDRSASMSTEDYYPAGELPDALADALPSNPSRYALARAALTAENGRLLKAIGKNFDVAVRDTGGGEVSLETEDDAAPAWAGESRLGDAVLRALDDPSGPPQGVLLLSDGQNTAGRSLSEAAESARRLGVPLLAVGVGRDSAPPDVELGDLIVDDVTFVDDLLAFRATLRVQASTAEQVRVTLTRDGGAAPLAEQTIDVPTGASSHDVLLVYRPESPGSLRAAISAAAVTGERDASNNKLTRTIDVRDQKIKVLLAAAYPNYEFRYLKNLIDRDSTVESSTFLQESDLDYTATDPTAVARLPITARELAQYDAVVLIDFDPRQAPRSFWGGLRQFVVETGGGVVFVAGPRSLPHDYAAIADFAELAPIDPSGSPAAAGKPVDAFRVAPTPFGLQAPSLQLGTAPDETRRLWTQLEPLYWWTDIGQLKPAAQVWATHPTALTGAGKPAPLIVAQYAGAGRVVMHAIDSTWRWRRRTGDALFARYWVQTLRWLARGKLLAENRSTRLATDRTNYEVGQTVRVEVQQGSAGDQPPGVLLQTDGGEQQRLELSPVAGAAGRYAASLGSLAAGEYRLLLAGADPDAPRGAGAVSAAFRVTPPPGEMSRLQRNREALRAAADRSRGAYFDIEQVDQLAGALPPGRAVAVEPLPPVELWNRWWMLLAITGCLTTEWILRKRKAML